MACVALAIGACDDGEETIDAGAGGAGGVGGDGGMGGGGDGGDGGAGGMPMGGVGGDPVGGMGGGMPMGGVGGEGGGDPVCAGACEQLADCTDDPALCSGLEPADHAQVAADCVEACEADPTLAALIDGDACAETIAIVSETWPAFADACEPGDLPATNCDPEAPVPQLCSPPGEASTLAVDLRVVYADFDDIVVWHKPGNTMANAGKMCAGDTYQRREDKSLRTYQAKFTDDDNWLAPNYPGPTLRVKIGDTLRLNLENAIDVQRTDPDHDPENHDACADGSPRGDVAPNCFHGFDTTNIHYHGTHVSPADNHDNVFVKLYPPGAGYQPNPENFEFVGQTPTYELHFTDAQAPGTHWYHAHKHGSTALQMLNGLAGALIIDGDFDGIPEIQDAREQILVLQEIDDDLNLLQPPPQRRLNSHNPTLVNGELTPTIRMRPGEVQRWRFISATQHASASLAGLGLRNVDGRLEFPLLPDMCRDGQPTELYDYGRPGVYQIAQDGVEFLDDRWPDVLCNQQGFLDISLDSGNRADFLVVAPRARERIELFLTADRLVGGNPNPPDEMGNEDCDPQPEWGELVPDPKQVALVRIVIEPEIGNRPQELPRNLRRLQDLPQPLQDSIKPIADEPVDREQTVSFSMNPSQGLQPQFYIDCKKFCEERVDHCMVLGDTEEWTIYNYTTVGHPFHIHINPFFVTHYFDANDYFGEGGVPFRPGEPLPEDAGLLADDDPRRRWQDTIALPKSFSPAGLPNLPLAPIVPGFIKIKHRFLDYTGDFVIHCHILGHEDRGMMQRIGVRATEQECMDALAGEAPGCEPPSECCQTCLTAAPGLDVPDECKTEGEGRQAGQLIHQCIDALPMP